MTTDRREVFQPEELSILGSAFDQIWNTVGAELGDIDPTHEVAARKRLANIMVLLARSDDLRRRGNQGSVSPDFSVNREAERSLLHAGSLWRGHGRGTERNLASSPPECLRVKPLKSRLDTAIVAAAKFGISSLRPPWFFVR
jgi:hypothetical protein